MHSCNADNYAKEAVSTPVMQGNVIRIAILKENNQETQHLCNISTLPQQKNTIGKNTRSWPLKIKCPVAIKPSQKLL